MFQLVWNFRAFPRLLKSLKLQGYLFPVTNNNATWNSLITSIIKKNFISF